MSIAKYDEPEVAVLHHSGWDQLEYYHDESSEVKSNYAITGHESQVLTIRLAGGGAGESSCKGESGSMMYLTSGIRQTISCDGCFGRCCAGESCWVVNFTNIRGDRNGYVSLTPNFPTCKVVPVDLKSSDVGGTLIAQSGAFMASYGNVDVDVSFDCNLTRCCCGGLGLTRQKLQGDGTVFIAGTGTMVQKVLQPGETILVDTHCVMAFGGNVTMDLRRVGGIVGMLGSGEGIFNTTLTGPGLVIVQSMNDNMFKESLAAQKLYRR